MDDTERLARVARGVEQLRVAALAAEREFAPALAAVAPEMRESARNLVHYLGVRRLDARDLQVELARLGLSSLGRMEAHVLASLHAVLAAIQALRHEPLGAVTGNALGFDAGDGLLAAHAEAILGPAPRPGCARIMVTMPSEAAEEPQLVSELLDAGMDIMRINCAHDGVGAWTRMLEHLRRIERDASRRCVVAFDLAGPKLRTGPIEPGLPKAEQRVLLRRGDQLDLVRGTTPGREAVHDIEGRVVQPAFVSCELAEVFRGARPGEAILFDDGKIRGIIREASADRLRIEITAAASGSAKLRAEKGINLPDSELDLPAITPKDLADLPFVAMHADMVAISFVKHPEDIDALQAELARLEAPPVGIVLKIETRVGFERLPELLLAAMRRPPVAVMLARGDLGVEVGFERLAEVQEEILWLCEAAHVPVIWATQVLESLAKGGVPSRAEVTDAAMGSRAECVMLNKGPFIRETMRFLTDVLRRMEEHQHKKASRLRKLRVSASPAPRARRPRVS